ncbi:unnamed protein product [Vitrella brassicaformis CCMP3155]|uniref:Rhodanese domain-containing protein n=2 Tax=Vitrella brassicaformis TaxID=1169539 RepID=A0A0G4EAQ6_VITBC|nr:unnamed protein product [Vitrella brassicaformis CCMP3155]|eukprot:CEL92372.1 unnamed protein product [Vitrella brassicaformis CCMP3155]
MSNPPSETGSSMINMDIDGLDKIRHRYFESLTAGDAFLPLDDWVALLGIPTAADTGIAEGEAPGGVREGDMSEWEERMLIEDTRRMATTDPSLQQKEIDTMCEWCRRYCRRFHTPYVQGLCLMMRPIYYLYTQQQQPLQQQQGPAQATEGEEALGEGWQDVSMDTPQAKVQGEDDGRVTACLKVLHTFRERYTIPRLLQYKSHQAHRAWLSIQEQQAHVVQIDHLFHSLLTYHNPWLARHLGHLNVWPTDYAINYIAGGYALANGATAFHVLQLWQLLVVADEASALSLLTCALLIKLGREIAEQVLREDTIKYLNGIELPADIHKWWKEAVMLGERTPSTFSEQLSEMAVGFAPLYYAPDVGSTMPSNSEAAKDLDTRVFCVCMSATEFVSLLKRRAKLQKALKRQQHQQASIESADASTTPPAETTPTAAAGSAPSEQQQQQQQAEQEQEQQQEGEGEDASPSNVAHPLDEFFYSDDTHTQKQQPPDQQQTGEDAPAAAAAAEEDTSALVRRAGGGRRHSWMHLGIVLRHDGEEDKRAKEDPLESKKRELSNWELVVVDCRTLDEVEIGADSSRRPPGGQPRSGTRLKGAICADADSILERHQGYIDAFLLKCEQVRGKPLCLFGRHHDTPALIATLALLLQRGFPRISAILGGWSAICDSLEEMNPSRQLYNQLVIRSTTHDSTDSPRADKDREGAEGKNHTGAGGGWRTRITHLAQQTKDISFNVKDRMLETGGRIRQTALPALNEIWQDVRQIQTLAGGTKGEPPVAADTTETPKPAPHTPETTATGMLASLFPNTRFGADFATQKGKGSNNEGGETHRHPQAAAADKKREKEPPAAEPAALKEEAATTHDTEAGGDDMSKGPIFARGKGGPRRKKGKAARSAAEREQRAAEAGQESDSIFEIGGGSDSDEGAGSRRTRRSHSGRSKTEEDQIDTRQGGTHVATDAAVGGALDDTNDAGDSPHKPYNLMEMMKLYQDHIKEIQGLKEGEELDVIRLQEQIGDTHIFDARQICACPPTPAAFDHPSPAPSPSKSGRFLGGLISKLPIHFTQDTHAKDKEVLVRRLLILSLNQLMVLEVIPTYLLPIETPHKDTDTTDKETDGMEISEAFPTTTTPKDQQHRPAPAAPQHQEGEGGDKEEQEEEEEDVMFDSTAHAPTTQPPPQPQPQPAPAAPLAPSPASSQQTGSTPSPPPSPSKQPPGAPAPPSPSTLSSSSKGSGPGWLATVGHKMQSLAHKTILTPAAAESAADKGAARPSQHEQASASPSAADGDRFDHSNEVVVYVCEGRVRLNWPFEGLDGYRRVRRDGREGYTGVSMDECRAIVRANHRLQFLKRIFFQEDAPDRVTIVLKNDTSFEFEIDNQQEFLNSVKSRLSALNIGMKMSST